jgi:hypothetical protein
VRSDSAQLYRPLSIIVSVHWIVDWSSDFAMQCSVQDLTPTKHKEIVFFFQPTSTKTRPKSFDMQQAIS